MLKEYKIIVGDKQYEPESDSERGLHFLQMSNRIVFKFSLLIIPITVVVLIFCQEVLSADDRTKFVITLSVLVVETIALVLLIMAKVKKLKVTLEDKYAKEKNELT
jgi:hypothetical protein